MKKDRTEGIEFVLCVLLMGLIPLHLYLGFINIGYGIDKGYGHSFPLRCYVLAGVYLLVVLAADLFIICRRKFGLSKEFCRYWGSACIGIMIGFLILSVRPEGGMIAFLFLFYSPFFVFFPLLEFLEREGILLNLTTVGGFCFFNWAVCRFFVRKK